MINLYDYLYDIRNSLPSKNKVGGGGGGGGGGGEKRKKKLDSLQ